MDKKYQVFVSSTYEDLREERQEVIHALLELDCIPSGMELFPAADEDQWSLIKGVIDECDYYILIVAGRYGSCGSDGISYTEKEYRYALETGKPIIAFLHKAPDTLPKNKTEKAEEGQKKLEAFRNLAQKKMCKFWTSPQELGSVVSRSMVKLQKQHPGIGWVRGDLVPSQEASIEILEMRKKIEKLEAELQKVKTQAPSGTEKLAQGDDLYKINFTFQCNKKNERYSNSKRFSHSIDADWNIIFYQISPLMINEASERDIKKSLNQMIRALS